MIDKHCLNGSCHVIWKSITINLCYPEQGDLGFPLGEGRQPSLEGWQPPTWALFGKNVDYAKTKELGPFGGMRAGNFCM